MSQPDSASAHRPAPARGAVRRIDGGRRSIRGTFRSASGRGSGVVEAPGRIDFVVRSPEKPGVGAAVEVVLLDRAGLEQVRILGRVAAHLTRGFVVREADQAEDRASVRSDLGLAMPRSLAAVD